MVEEGSDSAGTGKGLPRCSWHDASPATAMCVSCARPVCRDCDRFMGYRHYCPECAPFVPAAYPYPVPPPIPYQPPEPSDEREKRWWRADWGLLEVFVAWIVIFGLYNVVGVILYVFAEDPLFFNYLAYALVFCPLIAASVWFIPRRHGRGWKELGWQWGRLPRTVTFGTLGSLVALGLSYGAFFLIYLIFSLLAGRGPVSGETESMQDLGSGYLALVIVVVVILAPIFEELFFRGLFYPALRRRTGPTWAIIINGVVFGVIHFQPLFMLSLILVGIVLAYLYEKTDSLAAPIIAHSLYNLAVIMVSLLAGW
jgi:membrane protease YdiL (CAAX protease family)